ncbi:MAG TPA: hypothetical protein VEH04_16780 [Verrucomicrobiae bacterium]|nr:hypothetical protein [Verrucomicrobiae bacterium]
MREAFELTYSVPPLDVNGVGQIVLPVPDKPVIVRIDEEALVWKAAARATSYIIQTLEGTLWQVVTTTTELSYPEPAVGNYYRVLAHNTGGNSNPSNAVRFTGIVS